MSDFFNRVDLLRKKKGESIVDVARFLGISGPAVHGWKKGGLPKPDKLRLLAEHFGVSVEWLMTGVENTAGHRLQKSYDQLHETRAQYCVKCAQLESELREARAVIRDQAATLAALTEKKNKEPI